MVATFFLGVLIIKDALPIAIVVTIVTGVDYCVQAAKLYKDAKSGGSTQTGGDAQRG